MRTPRAQGRQSTSRHGHEHEPTQHDLHGDAGFRHIVTNARGRQITTGSGGVIDALPEDQLPDPGDNLLLTLDLELQLCRALGVLCGTVAATADTVKEPNQPKAVD